MEQQPMISLLPQPTCFFRVSGEPVQSMMDYLPLGHIFKEGAKTNWRISQLGVIGCARPARAISTGRRTPDTRDLCSQLSEYHSISHQVPRLKDLHLQYCQICGRPIITATAHYGSLLPGINNDTILSSLSLKFCHSHLFAQLPHTIIPVFSQRIVLLQT